MRAPMVLGIARRWSLGNMPMTLVNEVSLLAHRMVTLAIYLALRSNWALLGLIMTSMTRSKSNLSRP
jgi:hypothetical protein